MTNESDWTNPLTLTWRLYLLDSYAHWTGKELISRSDSSFEQAQRLFDSPFVVVSYALQDDPVLNYGNRTALDLWEMDWDRFTQTPSRLTAEPVNREERARMLSQARKQGYLPDYRSIRISSTGKRFLVERRSGRYSNRMGRRWDRAQRLPNSIPSAPVALTSRSSGCSGLRCSRSARCGVCANSMLIRSVSATMTCDRRVESPLRIAVTMVLVKESMIIVMARACSAAAE